MGGQITDANNWQFLSCYINIIFFKFIYFYTPTQQLLIYICIYTSGERSNYCDFFV